MLVRRPRTRPRPRRLLVSVARYTKGNGNFLLVAALEGCQGLVECNRSKTEDEDEFEDEDD